MANTVVIRTLLDNSHKTIIHAYLESDNSSGELSGQVLVDVSTLSGAPTKVAINHIDASLAGFSARVYFDANTLAGATALPADKDSHLCWENIGGLSNNAGTGITGDIKISTTGFTATGDAGSITIELIKTNVGQGVN